MHRPPKKSIVIKRIDVPCYTVTARDKQQRDADALIRLSDGEATGKTMDLRKILLCTVKVVVVVVVVINACELQELLAGIIESRRDMVETAQ